MASDAARKVCVGLRPCRRLGLEWNGIYRPVRYLAAWYTSSRRKSKSFLWTISEPADRFFEEHHQDQVNATPLIDYKHTTQQASTWLSLISCLNG
jgi:hypothetical protein